MDKNIARIIYGVAFLIIIVFIFLYIKNKNVAQENNNTERWETYKNEELNIEVKHPKGVEIDVQN